MATRELSTVLKDQVLRIDEAVAAGMSRKLSNKSKGCTCKNLMMRVDVYYIEFHTEIHPLPPIT